MAAPESARPTVREENRERTRRRILEATAELVLMGGGLTNPELFTFANVAERAGVSERTVYRFFPTKQALGDAYEEERVIIRGKPLPTTAEDYVDLIRSIGREWGEELPGVVPRPEPAWAEDYDDAFAAQRTRDSWLLAAVEAALPAEVPDRQRLAIAAVLHSACSLHALVTAASRWGLTLAEAGEAVGWMGDTLLEALQNKELPSWDVPPPSNEP